MASDSWQPLSSLDQKDHWQIMTGCLVAVDQRDEQKQWAESDGTCQHRFHQQNCPAAQKEDVDEQSAHTKTTNTTKIVKGQFWQYSEPVHSATWWSNKATTAWSFFFFFLYKMKNMNVSDSLH